MNASHSLDLADRRNPHPKDIGPSSGRGSKGVVNSLILSSLILAVGCTSIYQVRGVESELESPVVVNEIEDDQIDSRKGLLQALEARSVESLKLCPSSASYRKNRRQCSDAEPFKIGILEVNSDGSLNPIQKSQVFSMLEGEAKKARCGQNLVILVFIHGWHHGAHVCDSNLACFRRLVGGLANVYGPSWTGSGKTSRFVGIYFAWRGEAVEGKGFNAITIYHRKRMAEHIGRSGGTNLLLDLDSKYRELKGLAQEDASAGDVLMVTAGHSLGGGMLLSALQTKLVGTVQKEQFIRSSSQKLPSFSDQTPTSQTTSRPVISGFGDLSVLVNAAVEASEFNVFEWDLTEVIEDPLRQYADDQTPVLLVLTSTADRANRTAFPASRLLLPWNWFKGGASHRALGHYTPYRTHELSSTKTVAHGYQGSSCGCAQYVVGRALSEAQELAAPKESFRAMLDYGLSKNYLILKPVFEPGWDDNSPFWVVRSDASVIAAHNDIYNENVVRFLVVFLNTYFSAKGF